MSAQIKDLEKKGRKVVKTLGGPKATIQTYTPATNCIPPIDPSAAYSKLDEIIKEAQSQENIEYIRKRNHEPEQVISILEQLARDIHTGKYEHKGDLVAYIELTKRNFNRLFIEDQNGRAKTNESFRYGFLAIQLYKKYTAPKPIQQFD